MKFAEVAFNLPLDHLFSYKIPNELIESTYPGSRVLAPFGNRFLTGVVVQLKDKVTFDNCKEITDTLDDKPFLSDEILALTKWMSEYYISSWGQAISLALPKGIEESSKQRIYISPDFEVENETLTERQKELFNLIYRQPGNTSKYYQEKFGKKSFHFLLKKLSDENILVVQKKIDGPSVKTQRRYFITVPSDFNDRLKILKKVNEKVKNLDTYKGKEILFTDFVKNTELSSSVINRLVSKSILLKEKKEIVRLPEFSFEEVEKDIKLTTEQKAALDQIISGIDSEKFKTFLVHGVTGCGKTQIYLESIQNVYERGKSAILLIPEISLTPQTASRFKQYFKNKITVFHSKMSLGERYDAWCKIYNEEKSIVVGPRSALFMPVKNLGIIIVDEEHDGSYKQNESSPRYHARDVAIYRAKMNNAVVILGSATPSLESYTNARKNKYTLLEIKNRIGNISLPKVSIVDLRGIKKSKAESVIFSPVLIEKIKERFDKSEQVILLQNRRGYSSYQQCTECGYIARCPNCEVSLTYHSYNNKIQCHYCNYNRNAVDTCPKCNGYQIKYSGTGTQKIEIEINKIFPGAKYIRMDQDTTKSHNAHDIILDKFRRKEVDMLLGTQMISKGLDFKEVTLVGVISADVGLSLPDYRASERTFQLLTQVAGRSGRGKKTGEVIIQSYQFTHPAVQLARNHDFHGFYQNEIKNRAELDYPPFSRIINIKILGSDLNNTISISRDIASKIRKKQKKEYKILGPAPCPLAKIRNLYRWQIIVKVSKDKDPTGKKTNGILKELLKPYIQKYQKDLRVQVDVDPVDLM